MSHTVEILSVGTELLLGNIANTDAQMLSQGLSALGINVYYHRTSNPITWYSTGPTGMCGAGAGAGRISGCSS